jgi:signal transduction histidine kinase
MFGATKDLSVEEWRRRNFKLHDSQGREIPPGQAPIVRALAGEEVKPHELRLTFPDGHMKWLHVAAHPFSVLGLTGVFVVITDETEQVNLRKAVEHFQRIEEFAVLAGGLAHDFNNILSLVSENVALALGDEDLKEIHARLRQMRDALKKGAALVERLTHYSHPRETEIRSIEINDVVNAALELARPLIRNHVRVKTEVSRPLPAVAADSSRLEQVLVNLILNALDAMPGGGELKLCAKLAPSGEVPSGGNIDGNDQFVLITIADTGTGIPEELRGSIFDVVFTTKPAGKGAGLGLASAQAIVRQHKGYIKVESEPGAGTKFSALHLARRVANRMQRRMRYQSSSKSGRRASSKVQKSRFRVCAARTLRTS